MPTTVSAINVVYMARIKSDDGRLFQTKRILLSGTTLNSQNI